MDPFSTAAALGTALKAAMDITDGLLKGSGSAAFKAQILELQGVIFTSQRQALTAQASEQALLQSKRDLEEEIARMKAWDAGDKQRYALKAIGGSAFAFALKPDMQNGEPPHWLCAQCYEEGKKSFMQDQGRTPDRQNNNWRCNRCKNAFITSWGRNPKSVAEEA